MRIIRDRVHEKGFTLIEVMIYVGLTAMLLGLFGGILITVTRIQTQQTASAQVTQELSFLMESMKRYVRSAKTVSAGAVQLVATIDPSTTPATTVSVDFLPAEHSVVLTEGGPSGTMISQLSSTKVRIEDLHFTKSADGDSTAVTISITASASTTNSAQVVTRTLESTAAPLLQAQ